MKSKRVALGWDAFVDRVWQIVKKKKGKDITFLNSMAEFQEQVKAAVGTGLSTEIKEKYSRGGGFTVNTGRALGELGVPVYLVGLYGRERIQSIFQELPRTCELISYGEPCYSHIFEFEDGKLMFPQLENIEMVDWSYLKDNLGRDTIGDIAREVEIFGLGYWDNMPHFRGILSSLLRIVSDKELKIFLDPGNVKNRSPEDFRRLVDFFRKKNDELDIIMSFNGPEFIAACRYLDLKIEDKNEIRDNMIAAAEKFAVKELIVHTPKFSISCSENNVEIHEQKECKSPVLTTGAGDTFNGGYLRAMLQDYSQYQRLKVANGTARFYVEKGYPPGAEELSKYIQNCYV